VGSYTLANSTHLRSNRRNSEAIDQNEDISFLFVELNSSNVMEPLRLLHLKQDGTKLSSPLSPQWDIGIIWSVVIDSTVNIIPQYIHFPLVLSNIFCFNATLLIFFL
jgi:hypothetical protein